MTTKSTKQTGTRTIATKISPKERVQRRMQKAAATVQAIREAGKPAGERAGKPTPPLAKDNILLRVEPGQFADALNKATVEQLEDALKLDCWSAKSRRRIEAALACRKQTAEAIADGQKAAAENIAKTVAAVGKGNLAKPSRLSPRNHVSVGRLS